MSRHRRQQRRRMRVGARTAFIRMLARVRGDFSAAQVERLVFADSEFLRLVRKVPVSEFDRAVARDREAEAREFFQSKVRDV